MNIYPFSALYPNGDLIPSPDSFFSAAGKEYINFRNSGFFIGNMEKAIFIYRIEGEKKYTGIIAGNDISDLENNKILGHENTITEKEQSMLSLLLLRKAMIKPVLLAYSPSEEINAFTENYINNNDRLFSFTLSNPLEKHTFWAITDAAMIENVKALFKKYISKVYIADGHHRASIAAKLVKKNYLHDHDDLVHPGLLCAFFPFNDLTIYDFNRVVELPEQMSLSRFMVHLAACFDITVSYVPVKPNKKHQITLYINHEWYILNWKSSLLQAYVEKNILLDVDLFNVYILQKILHITDIKSTSEVKYTEGVVGIENLMNAAKNPGTALFCFFPVSKEDVISISDAGDVLPPKSTWFEPRMKNGLIIKEF